MPDMMSETGAAPASAGTPAPASTPAPATPPASAPAPQPSTSPGPAPSSTVGNAAQPGAAQPFSLRQAASQFIPGADQRYQDDASLARDLFAALQQARDQQQFVQIGQRYQQHSPEIERFLAEKAAQAQQQQQQGNQWWKAPEFDPNWMNQVLRDPNTGQLVSKPGAPLDIPQRIAAWQNFQSEKLNEFMKNPVDMLKPGIEGMVTPLVEKMISERIERMEAARYANTYVQKNLDWIAAKDAQGNPIPDGRGGWVMTGAGQRMAEYVDRLHKAGVTNPQMQQEMAEKMLMGDLAMLQQQQAQRAAAGQQQQHNAQQQPAFAPLNNSTQGGNVGNANLGNNLPPGQSLKDALMAEFASKGLLGKTLV